MVTFNPTQDSYEVLEKQFLKKLFQNEVIFDETIKILAVLPFEEREAIIQILSTRMNIHSSLWRDGIKTYTKK